jgi:hypothetical protein
MQQVPIEYTYNSYLVEAKEVKEETQLELDLFPKQCPTKIILLSNNIIKKDTN